MRSLILINIFHILRSKLLLALIVLSVVVQFLGLKIALSTTLYVQGNLKILQENEWIFAAVILQLGLGTFVSAVYGLWLVPYIHKGPRRDLTYTLPVSKWHFLFVYSLCLLGLILLQYGILLFCYGWVFGAQALSIEVFPWLGLALVFLIQLLACWGIMFAFASGAVTLGLVPTLFLGAAALFFLAVGGAIFKVNIEQFVLETPSWFHSAQLFFSFMPPVGEFPFLLRGALFNYSFDIHKMGVVVFWTILFMAWFCFKLVRPFQKRLW